MDLFSLVKRSVPLPQAAAHYGLQVKPNGMTRCPFHEDHDPSLKLNDTYYYCFGCGAAGDVVDLVAQLFGLNCCQAAKKIARDFGLDPDGPPAGAIALSPPHIDLTGQQQENIAYYYRVLTNHLDQLHEWREQYKPSHPEGPLDGRFVEALRLTDLIEYLTDPIAYGTPQQKAAAANKLLTSGWLSLLECRINTAKEETYEPRTA